MVKNARPWAPWWTGVVVSCAVTTCAFTAHAQLDGVAPGNTADEPWAGKAVAPPTRLNVTRAAKSPESKRSVVPAVVLGVLWAGGIGSGIAFGLVSFNVDLLLARSIIVARHGTCMPNVGGYDARWCPELQREVNAYVTFADASIGAFVVGGAAAVATALYLLWPSPRDIRLAPILSPSARGLVVSGSF